MVSWVDRVCSHFLVSVHLSVVRFQSQIADYFIPAWMVPTSKQGGGRDSNTIMLVPTEYKLNMKCDYYHGASTATEQFDVVLTALKLPYGTEIAKGSTVELLRPAEFNHLVPGKAPSPNAGASSSRTTKAKAAASRGSTLVRAGAAAKHLSS